MEALGIVKLEKEKEKERKHNQFDYFAEQNSEQIIGYTFYLFECSERFS